MGQLKEINFKKEKNIFKISLVNDGIKKLVDHEYKIEKKEYDFHKKDCCNGASTPFNNRNNFYKRGKSSSNSIKYQCKKCKKITNVLPENIDFIYYYQQQNDYLYEMLQMIINNKTINEICKKLNITNKTYYHKLQLLSNKFTNFQNRFEDSYFMNKSFDNIYINSNIYTSDQKKWKMIMTCDFLSGYIFRCDIETNIKYFENFYTRIAVPHFYLIIRNKKINYLNLVTSNIRLYDEIMGHLDRKIIPIIDDDENQSIKYVEYLKDNVKRLNSPYIHFYQNIFKVIYNFTYTSCVNADKLVTPAQSLNLTDKKYSIKNIILNEF